MGAHLSPTEQKEKVISLLGEYLTTMGIHADVDKLFSRLEAIDVAGEIRPASSTQLERTYMKTYSYQKMMRMQSLSRVSNC